ncbi:MAG: PDZ domain-containing protein, partial [Burkholderiaceae bacterium]
LGLGKPTGALVQGVESGSPADKAGVEPGDIILKVDGKTVEKSGDLPRLIGATKPGSRATLQVLRRGSTREVVVTVGEFEPEKPRRAAGSEPRDSTAPKLAFGLTVSDTTEALRKELRIRGGVRVEAVEGAAARAGLREGDVILAFDNQEVSDARQFAALVKKAEGSNKPVPLVVNRGGSTNLLVLRPR